jgi:hypothetical protein
MTDTAIYEEYEPEATDATRAERASVGQRLADLQTARWIEKYYWARGEWHIVLAQGQRIVLKHEQADIWISGFRRGLVAQAVTT